MNLLKNKRKGKKQYQKEFHLNYLPRRKNKNGGEADSAERTLEYGEVLGVVISGSSRCYDVAIDGITNLTTSQTHDRITS